MTAPGERVLVLGEIRTALLRNSTPALPSVVRSVLELRAGEVVRTSERPNDYGVSPDMLTGIDCRLPTEKGRKVRGIGTVNTRASVTGGRVLQTSTYAALMPSMTDTRAPWAHYLARPGVLELMPARASAEDIRNGHLGSAVPDVLDLGAINDRTMDLIQRHPALDGRRPFGSRRVTLRWTAEEAVDDTPRAVFIIASDQVRTMRVSVPAKTELAAVVHLCEDLAVHDWLLTTLLELIERGQRAVEDPAQLVESMRPATEHLMHLWSPGARVDDQLQPIWTGFERRPGFSRQWKASVNRIRDGVAMATARLLSSAEAAARPAPATLAGGSGGQTGPALPDRTGTA